MPSGITIEKHSLNLKVTTKKTIFCINVFDIFFLLHCFTLNNFIANANSNIANICFFLQLTILQEVYINITLQNSMHKIKHEDKA